MAKFTLGLGDIRDTVVDRATIRTVDIPVQGPLGVRDVVADRIPVIQVGEQQVDPNTVKESEGSKMTFHSTLFEGFRLKAVATYNFYTRDEETSFVVDVSASLDQLPRYVTLTWGTSPRRSSKMQSSKGVKQFLTAQPAPRPVVSFDIAATSAANGYVQAGVLSAIIAAPAAAAGPPKLDEDAFLSDPQAAGQLAASHVARADSPFTTQVAGTVDHLRVNFVDPSIAGALIPGRLAVATQDVHLTNAASLSKVASGLEIISEFNQDVTPKNPPPTFPAPPETPTLSYVGYLIERHDISSDGSMRLGRTIRIDDVDTGYFVDREVLYGMTYSYRIRSVVQWVHPPTYGFEGVSTVDRVAPVEEVIGTKVASYYYGDWSDWSRVEVVDLIPPDPPDELTVQTFSKKGLIRVAWKMPNDPQLDIHSMTLLRAVVSEGSITDWTTLGEFEPGNGAYDDRDVSVFEETGREYVYAMFSTSFHGNTSTLGEQVRARLGRRSSTREHLLVRTAPIGADPTAHPTLGEPRESTEVVATRRVVLYCRGSKSVHPLRDRDYLLDVRSLSTGERVQVSLNVDSTEILSKDA